MTKSDAGTQDRTEIPRAIRAGWAQSWRREGNTLAATLYAQQFAAEVRGRYPNEFADQAARTDVESQYFGPLVELLASHAESDDPTLRDLYLGEWRRYAPHRLGLTVLSDYYREVLPLQEQALAAASGGDAADVRSWLQAVHRPLVVPPDRVFRLLMVGDCLMGEIQTFLTPKAAAEGLAVDCRYFYFSSLIGADIESDGIKRAITDGIDAIGLSYLTYQGIPLYRSLLEGAERSSAAEVSMLIDGIVSFMAEHLRQIRELTVAPILLHNASGLPLTRWRRLLPMLPPLSAARQRALADLNRGIAELAASVENCSVIDEVAIAAERGLRRAGQPMVSRALAARANFHHSWIASFLADAYLPVVVDMARLQKAKALLVDFDNTLWDGVMADGPVTQFHDRQQLLRSLAEQGVLLCAVSKNDAANVRWDEMTLKPEDFAALKINWNLKVQSAAELATELNLGLDAFVFLDDHQSERALMAHELPAVVVLDSTRDDTWRAIARLSSMPNTTRTAEARERTAMYRQQADRTRAMDTGRDYPALMRSLGLKARIGRARAADLDRLTELVQRTNQFNTTTIRYSRGELEAMLRDEARVILAGELEDRFGTLGLVGVVVVGLDGSTSTVDSFIMSCRAMGFGFEHALMAAAVDAAGARAIRGRFVPTDRNEPASNLFPATGFAAAEGGHWHLPAGSTVERPAWIEVAAR